jgi:hypothetical protein
MFECEYLTAILLELSNLRLTVGSYLGRANRIGRERERGRRGYARAKANGK